MESEGAPKPINNTEEINKKFSTFNEKFHSIKFPEDFEIELTNDSRKQSPLHFLVRKQDAPNTADVIVWAGYSGEDTPQWEIIASDKDAELDNDSIQHVLLEDTEGLIKAIEKTLYFEPNEIIPNEDDYHEEEKTPEIFNPIEYRDNEFKTEYAEILAKASSNKIKNREIVDDILEMERLLTWSIFPDHEHGTSYDYDEESLEEYNELRKKYNLPILKIYSRGNHGRYYLSQLEDKPQKQALVALKKKELEEFKGDFSMFERDLNDYGLNLEDLGMSEEEIKETHIKYLKDELEELKKENSKDSGCWHMRYLNHYEHNPFRYILKEWNLSLEDLGTSEEELRQEYIQYMKNWLEKVKRKEVSANDLYINRFENMAHVLTWWHVNFEDLGTTKKEVDELIENSK